MTEPATEVPARDAFPELTDPYRRELVAHCYRMTGSVHDAEDLVQETFLRAWKSYESYEGRASLRTWLYRIATNVCLTALEGDKRRPLPTGLGTAELRGRRPAGLQRRDPVARAGTRTPTCSTPPRSPRAAPRCGWPSWPPCSTCPPGSERSWCCATCSPGQRPRWPRKLDMTVAAANSALQRARERMGSVTLDEGALRDPEDARNEEAARRLRRGVLEQGHREHRVAARPGRGVGDAAVRVWYLGAENIGRLVERQCPGGVHEMRMLPAAANGQPAFGLYMRRPDGTFTPFHLQVLTLGDGPHGEPEVQHVAAFFDVALFKDFGLPALLPADFGG